MRVIVITQTGGPEVLQVQQRPDPRPGRGEVLIDVQAVGVNFADLLARIGLYPDAPKLPAVVGYEVAGTIAALGEGVEGGLRVGQRVMAPTHFGGYAERAVTPADGVVPIPDTLSFEQAAAGRMALAMPRFKLMNDSKSVLGLNALRLWDEFGSAARRRGPLLEFLADGTIQPVVAETFPFERAGEEHRCISERRNIGKVVLVP